MNRIDFFVGIGVGAVGGALGAIGSLFGATAKEPDIPAGREASPPPGGASGKPFPPAGAYASPFPDKAYEERVAPYFDPIEADVHAIARSLGVQVLAGRQVAGHGWRQLAAHTTWSLSEFIESPSVIADKAAGVRESIVSQIRADTRHMEAIGPMFVLPAHESKKLRLGYVIGFNWKVR